jgi:TRAP-type uncharacterized transport system substrate-binding protein
VEEFMRARRFLYVAAAVLGLVSANAGETFAQRSSTLRHSSEAQKKDEMNANVIGLAAGQLEGAPIRLATEIARVVDNGSHMHVLPIVTRGPAENLDALLYLRGVDLAIISTDIVSQFREKAPNLRNRVSYILNLFPSEVHVFVRPGIESLEDLRGKKVNFNTEGTAAAFSGPLIFDRLGLGVEKTFIPHQSAIEQMQSGDIVAVFFITSKPVDVFLKKKFPAGYKFLPIPYDDRLSDLYVPAVIGHADYPALVPEGSDVQTISVPTSLVAFNWPANSDRYRRVARFVTSLFDNLERLQSPGFDSKWASINLAASVPSLDRFPAAQEWLSRPSRESGPAVEREIDVNAARGQLARDTRLPIADQERLLRDFLRWARERR